MKLIDLNVLIYATDAESVHHHSARPWLAAVLETTETVGIPTTVAIGFVRLTTNPRVMRSPLEPRDSLGIIVGLLDLPTVVTPSPTRRHYGIMSELLERTGAAGNLVIDAHLATLAIEHGAELCSYDTDFARFPQLHWVHPGRC